MSLRSISDLPLVAARLADGDQDAHAFFRDVAGDSPLARTEVGFVLALRHRHLALINDDDTRQLETESKVFQGITDGPIFDFTRDAMLMANGETHVRRRAPVQRTFAFKLMDAMRPAAAAMAEELIQERLGRGPFDFVNEFAAQIPARIIADILGVPRSDLPIFLQWIADTAAALGVVDPERRPQIEASLIAFNAYVAELMADRRAHPREDFVTHYLNTTAKDAQLSDAEIRTQLLGLILAGSDTTRGSICMILAHLLHHPEQWAAFCADPDGLKRAVVEEGLRYDPVILGIPRVAKRDLDVDGYLLPAGCLIAVQIVTALRDPDVYAEPDAFNIFRTDHPKWHPIFGAGPHRCLGEALARAEMEEVLAAIARLAPGTRVVGAFPRLGAGAIRQIGPMQVAFDAQAATVAAA